MWCILLNLFLAGVRNYLKEALVNVIAVHAEVQTLVRHKTPFVHTSSFLKPSDLPGRSSQSRGIWFLEFCPELLNRLQTRCVALCSASRHSAKTEPFRYTLARTSSSSLIVEPWLICRAHIKWWGGDPPVFSDNATFQFELQTDVS